MNDSVSIGSADLSAEIALLGAELVVLRDREGRDLLWDGDPAFWTGRAPLLFPIVGAMAGGSYRVGGQSYELPQHGFARRTRFDLVAHGTAQATFRLSAGEATRAVYPFDFRLDVTFAIDGPSLSISAELTNPGDVALPASFGFHPAFRWPLPYGAPREAHMVRFSADETADVHRPDAQGLLSPREPTPVADRTLRLSDALFEKGAVMFTQLASRRVIYGAEGGGPALDIAFADMPHLGIWTKPKAGFLCIEPWQGFADLPGFSGEFSEKPGIVAVAPGESRRFGMAITLLAEAPAPA